MPDDNNNIPITAGEVTHDEYWFIQVSGIEWTYVIQQLIEKHLKDVPMTERPIILGATVKQEPIWMLRKKFLPAEVIVKATGITLETVLKEPTLKLSVSEKKGLPKATVEYWGTA